MNLDELKSQWQKPEQNKMDDDALAKMTRIESQARLVSVRRKMIVEACALSCFLFLYNNAFDGASRPLYANLLLIGSLLLYITGNVLSYYFIKNPVEGPNLKLSLQVRAARLRRIAAFSLASSAIYAATLLVFFTSSIKWTADKYYTLILLTLIFSGLFYFSFRMWKKKVAHFEQLLMQFEEG